MKKGRFENGPFGDLRLSSVSTEDMSSLAREDMSSLAREDMSSVETEDRRKSPKGPFSNLPFFTSTLNS